MPRKIFIGILALIVPPLAFLYLSRLRWALVYLVLAVLSVLGDYLLHKNTGYSGVGVLLAAIAVIHSIKMADIPSGRKKSRFYNKWWGVLAIPVVLFGLAFFVRAYLYEPFRIPSGSMVPTLEPGDQILVSKLGYGTYGTWGLMIHDSEKPAVLPQRGEVFTFQYPPDESLIYVQRVIGVPGDSISLKNAVLSVNNRIVSTKIDSTTSTETLGNETYTVQYMSHPFRHQDYEGVVPDGAYFVMGDNRNNARDSRVWGFLSEANLMGKVIARW